MYLNRDELMLLSRGGRVPRAQRPPPMTVPLPERTGPGRVARLVHSLRARRRPPRRTELDVQSYLRLEFTVDDER